MRKILLALLVGAAVYLAYRHFVLDPPVRVYRRFAEAWSKEDTPAAVALTSGEAVRKEVESRILRGVLEAPMEAYRGTRQEIESRVEDPDGDVVVTALMSVHFDPPGITSGVGGAMVGEFRHVARLHKTPEGWRVVAWTPKFLSARSTRPGR